MKKYTVRVLVYKPLKIHHMIDELQGTIDGDKISYISQFARLYMDEHTRLDDNLQTSTWAIKHKMKISNNSHDSVIQNNTLKMKYKDYFVPYYELHGKIKDYTYKKKKYTIRTVIPLQVVYNTIIWSENLINSYFHHPNKEFISNDITKIENYLRKYLISEDREKIIYNILSNKQEDNWLVEFKWE